MTADTHEVPALDKFYIAGEEVSEHVYRRHEEMLDALSEIASMMHHDAYQAWQARNDGFPGDYWHGLGTPEDAHLQGKRVGASQAAELAREALDG